MNLFATGATGFVGSHFVELALARGHHVSGSYNSGHLERRPTLERLRQLGAELHQVDVKSPESLLAAMRGADCVCHFAAAFRESWVTDEYFRIVNVDGTANALQAAAGVGARRFVFCSTAGIYGQRIAGTVTEKSRVSPYNAYEASKVAAEALVRSMAPQLGLEHVIVRPTAVYGPRDERLLKLFKSAAKGRFPLFGSGSGRRHMVYVTDLAEAFLQACTIPLAASEDFIVAGPRAAPLREMLGTLAQVVGRKSTGPSLPLKPMLLVAAVTEDVCGKLGIKPPLYRRRMDFYLNDASFDCSKAERLLGWKPAIDLPQGLAATFASYREAGQL